MPAYFRISIPYAPSCHDSNWFPFQVEALQEGIGRLRADIKEAKGRGEERERAQREQLAAMEKKLGSSTHEADSAETKLSLMESVISKLKVGTEDLYILAKVGSTPVLSLLGGETTGAAVAKSEDPNIPIVFSFLP